MKKHNDQIIAESNPLSVKGRVILHIDMNAFYCSVHEATEPHLYKGKAIAVAGSVELRKGIVVTSSYSARARGVRTGMQVREALKMCPEIIIIPPNFDLYREYSLQFMKIVYGYSPLIEAMSIDECYVDITGSKQFGSAEKIAQQLHTRIMNELLLPCSIGIAPNKLLAKMASDLKKPNGISILRIRDIPQILWPKPCAYLFGIGQKTAEKLTKMNINTIGQLAAADEAALVREFGTLGHWLKDAANGLDRAPVNPEKEQSKSIGHTTTLPRNATELTEIQRILLNIADQVCRRLRKQLLVACTVQITVRDPDMKTVTRSSTLMTHTDNLSEIYQEACRLFVDYWKLSKPIRLLGITLQNLMLKEESAIQMDLFDYERHSKKEKLNKAMDLIRDKYGENAILTAGMLGDDPSALIRNHKVRGTSLQMDHMRGRSLDE